MDNLKIEDIGEFGLINHLTKNNETTNSSTILSVGDDAAVLDFLSSQCLISTDTMVEGIHFDLHYFPLKYLGYKIVAISVSDICAMYGQPSHLLLNMALSNRMNVNNTDELYQGIYEACKDYSIDLIGGDTTSSRGGLYLTSTVMGECKENQFVTRSGAKPGDIICVTGDLGAAYFGLLLLEREKEVFIADQNMKPDWTGKDYLLQKFLRPKARLDIINFLKEESILPTSMIDISDGLSSELLHICSQSQVGCEIYENKLPYNEQAKEMAFTFKISATTAALNGGEDYELLFTIKQDDYKKLENIDGITAIGYITERADEKNLITTNNQKVKLNAQGWQHF